MQSQRRRVAIRSAASLIEMLVMLAIIGILLGLTAVIFSAARQFAASLQRDADDAKRVLTQRQHLGESKTDGHAGLTKAPLTVSFDSTSWSANERDGAVRITVSLSSTCNLPVAVGYATSNGTATEGSDYTDANGTLTFNPGVTSLTFDVPMTRDLEIEGDETVQLALSDPGNASLGEAATATLTLADCAPQLEIATANPTICAGGFNSAPHQTVITATLTDGVAPFFGESISFSADNGGTLSASTADTDWNGEAYVVLTSSNKVGDSSTVTATVGGQDASCSVSFEAPDLKLVAGPTDAPVGAILSFAATLQWNGQPVPEHTLSWAVTGIWDGDGEQVYDGTGALPAGYGKLRTAATETDQGGEGIADFETGDMPQKVEIAVSDETIVNKLPAKGPALTKSTGVRK